MLFYLWFHVEEDLIFRCYSCIADPLLTTFLFACAASYFTYPHGNQMCKFVDTFMSDPPRFITTDVAVHIATAAVTQLPRLYSTNQLQ